MSTVDGTTLLSGASIAGDDYRYNSDRDDSPRKPVQTIAKGKLKSQPGGIFMTDADNALENRPYFVTIDKNGVLPALAKLDAQLKKVGYCVSASFFSRPYHRLSPSRVVRTEFYRARLGLHLCSTSQF